VPGCLERPADVPARDVHVEEDAHVLRLVRDLGNANEWVELAQLR
jgi:hypothetical protein